MVSGNPEALIAKALFGGYCWRQEFMKFGASSGCSRDSKSILWGRDLLLRGVGWRVGDGCKIIVFGHKWIPCSSNPYLILAPSGINNFQVRELIDWE